MTKEDSEIPRTAKQKRSRETHRRILVATLSCLADYGYANLSTQSIADKAEVSKGAIFRRFPSKVTLVAAAIEYYHELAHKKMEKLFTEGILSLPLTERVRIYIEGQWEIINTPEHISNNEVWIAARTDESLKNALSRLVINEQSVEDLSHLLSDHSQKPEITQLNHFICSALEGMAMDLVFFDDKQIDYKIEYLINLTINELSRLID